MAQVVKNKNKTKYDDIDKVLENKKSKKVEETPKKKNTKKHKQNKNEKKSLWEKFMIYCHGVKEEWKKIHWTKKYDLVKYSIAVIVFVILLAVFFYIIDVVFAAIQALFS